MDDDYTIIGGDGTKVGAKKNKWIKYLLKCHTQKGYNAKKPLSKLRCPKKSKTKKTKKAKTQKGGKRKKKALPSALKAWRDKVMAYKEENDVSLKEAMEALKGTA